MDSWVVASIADLLDMPKLQPNLIKNAWTLAGDEDMAEQHFRARTVFQILRSQLPQKSKNKKCCKGMAQAHDVPTPINQTKGHAALKSGRFGCAWVRMLALVLSLGQAESLILLILNLSIFVLFFLIYLQNRQYVLWTHWDSNPGLSACEVDVMPLHLCPVVNLAWFASVSDFN
eukprot:674125-Amphidinium_carterae.1